MGTVRSTPIPTMPEANSTENTSGGFDDENAEETSSSEAGDDARSELSAATAVAAPLLQLCSKRAGSPCWKFNVLKEEVFDAGGAQLRKFRQPF